MFAQTHATGIQHHHDVFNDFYRLFLDRDIMFYRCADFEQQDDTIESAQRRKADYLLNLIQPAAGECITIRAPARVSYAMDLAFLPILPSME